ncbi:hypothetical protein ACZ91_52040 [Streptomyces regensis]|nr:hypothetical protein ACZ91_52040 [Streptomyces regensis]
MSRVLAHRPAEKSGSSSRCAGTRSTGSESPPYTPGTGQRTALIRASVSTRPAGTSRPRVVSRARRAVLWPRWAVIRASASGSLYASSVSTRRGIRPGFAAHAAVAGSDQSRVRVATRPGWRTA